MSNVKGSINTTTRNHLDNLSARLCQARAVLAAVARDGEGKEFEQMDHVDVMNLLWTVDVLIEQAEGYYSNAYQASYEADREIKASLETV